MTSENCLFCRIARGDIPAQFLLETETVVAFRDLDPQAPVHVLVIPRVHVASLAAATGKEILGELLASAAAVARLEGLEESGYRVVVNTGSDGGQSVNHLHLHVLGGRQMNWPPG